MKRFFYKENGEGLEFSWSKSLQSITIAALPVVIPFIIGWGVHITNSVSEVKMLSSNFEDFKKNYEKQIEVLHKRISKESDDRRNEFENLIERQLMVMEKHYGEVYVKSKRDSKGD